MSNSLPKRDMADEVLPGIANLSLPIRKGKGVGHLVHIPGHPMVRE